MTAPDQRERLTRPATEADLPSQLPSTEDCLFVLSAADLERLEAYVAKVAQWLEASAVRPDFSDAIFTWQTARTAMKQRLAVKVRDRADLLGKLRAWIDHRESATGVRIGEARAGEAGARQAESGESAEQGVEAAIAQRDWDRLAELWVAGAVIDWQRLHAGSRPRRVGVPTYPFARERHWVEAVDAAPHGAAAGAPQSGVEQVLVAPVWEPAPLASAKDDSGVVPIDRHCVLLWGMEQVDAGALAALIPCSDCGHLPVAGIAEPGERYAAAAQSCFDRIKSIFSEASRGTVLFQVVVGDESGSEMAAGLSGLLKTAGEENSAFIGQVVLTQARSAGALAEQLRGERHRPNDPMVSHTEKGRHVLRWRPVRAEAQAVSFKQGGVYVITGGLGGLGVLFAEEILRTAPRARVILTGRAALAAARQQLLDRLSRQSAAQGGDPVSYRTLDLERRDAVETFVAEILSEYGRLDGIIHSAGMTADNLIVNKTADEFARVLVPKVAGTVHLDAASRHVRLDFFVLFSSATSAFGNPGQADYTAANGFLDEFATWRNRLVERGERTGRTLTIDWPMWQEGGMAIDAARLEHLRRTTGVVPMRSATGLRAFHDSLRSGCSRTMVLEGESDKIAALLDRATASAHRRAPRKTGPAIDAARLGEETLARLRQLFSEVTKRPSAKIDGRAELAAYGIDSIIISHMNLRLAEVFGEISKTLFFEHRTLSELAGYLVKAYPGECAAWAGVHDVAATATATVTVPAAPSQDATRPTGSTIGGAAAERGGDEPIAIIGISGIYPQASDLDEYWANLQSGRSAIREIPPDRWALDDFYVADVDAAVEQGKSYSKWGGFIDGFADFDPLFFNISPREALQIDPQERLFLQESWRALENAGYTRADLKQRYRQRVGVFAGITKPGFNLHARPAAAPGEAFFPYTSFSSAANRVSYFLDIAGPSMPVDTMCSSALTAIHEACEHIHRGECEIAFAGGVNLYLHPQTYSLLCANRMLSRDGECRSFGAGGNGFVPGEGVGVVLLKPLAAAIRDQDPIHGLILATHVNHGGKTNGYTVPSPRAQAELIRHAIDKAGIKSTDIGYIEAHGTGTALGDPIEIAGLQQAFAPDDPGHGTCRIGSAKSNIGHLEAAAGMAGLTKVLLQMKHEQIAPSLHASTLNPNIAFERTAFRVNTELSPWQPGRSASGEPIPRIAGVSSFGAAGANAHVIVQEYVAPVGASATAAPEAKVIVPLSARTAAQLEQRARDLLRFIRSTSDLDLAALSYTLQVGREAMDERLSCIVSSVHQLAGRLQAYVDGQREMDDFHRGSRAAGGEALHLFDDDEDFRETVDKWLARRKLARLAELWTRGIDLDWNKLYGDETPRRLALPTYPFARERLWVDAIVDSAPARGEGARAASLHPLLHANTSDLRRQQYTSVFTGNEFFLRDHQVNGEKVLPAVAYLEMARAAIDLAVPERADGAVLELHDTTWAQPIVVAGTQEVGIALHPDDSDGSIAFEIRTGEILHCQGQAVFSHEAPTPALDLGHIGAAMTTSTMDIAGLYDGFHAMGIDFGAAHRALAEVRLGQGQLLARLSLPAVVASTGGAYRLHPSVMDGALQASMGLVGAALSGPRRPMLPFALDTLRVLAACSGDMFAWVRRSDDAGAGGDLLKFDVDLCDPQGQVCVQLRGFSTRPLADAPVQSRPEEPQLHALIPVWSRVAPPTRGKPGRASKLLVMTAGGARALEWVRLSFPEAEALACEPNADVAAIATQLADRAFDHLLWMAPDVFEGEAEGDDLIGAQQGGVLGVFRLAKALLKLGHEERTLQWTLVTRNTQRVKRHDRIGPTHAAVAGLVGSLAKEYPQWDLRLLDVDGTALPTAEECLSWPGDKKGDVVAHRGGEWFRQGLARGVGLPEPAPAYRQGGVYVVIGGAGGIGEAWSRYMIERYDARLVWIGRRPVDEVIDEKLRALGSIGRAPLYFSADAADLDALREVRRKILQVHPAIHGVVHSAIDLQDQGVAAMDEPTFRRSLSAKVDVSVNTDEVFGDDDLDGMLFFSSLISFTKGAGQSNYAAGCSFKDSFAHAIAQRRRYPVRIMNWGYWGKVGVVTDEFYNKRMQQMGIGSIEVPEGMAALQTLVASELPQMALLKTLTAQALDGIAAPENVTLHAGHAPWRLPQALAAWHETFAAKEPAALQRDLLGTQAIELAGDILASTLASMQLDERSALPGHDRWLRTSLDHVRQHACRTRPLDAAWSDWEAQKAAWLVNPNVGAQVALLEACLRALPEILAGKRSATDVMFPDSSMRLVEGVYKGHALADYSNDALGAALVCGIRQMRQAGARDGLRILEIGAGTGGTTVRLLPMLREFGGAIAEYCYTDLSKAFLMHAEEHYRPGLPALTTAIFDVAKPLQGQAVAANRYDFVIATNVLHATPDIRETLRNAKALLKGGGVLLLNEMSAWTLFSHLTFGLLEGWWLHEDAALRLPGSPGLSPRSWQSVLEEEGFDAVSFVAEEAHALGQQVIAAQSDGVVRQRMTARSLAAAAIPAVKPEERRAPAAIAIAPVAGAGSLRDRCIAHLQGIVARTLRMDAAQVGPTRALADYGLDSILVVGLTNQLRQSFPGITSTLFFEVQNVAGLADHLLEHKKAHVIALLGDGAVTPVPRLPAPPRVAPRHDRGRTRFARGERHDATPPSSVFDVAIVGISGRYPQAPTLGDFWRNLAAGRNCVAEIPADRWDWGDYYDPEKGKPGRIYTKWGGFLEDIDKFDPLFFRISPKEAKAMDPQERLFLESCYHAIEDAGYTPDTLGEIDRIGVFAGVMNARYSIQPLHYSIANRVSFALNLQGPSMAVDTACSSSLTAIHLALESLYSGSSSCAIAGGVNLIIDAAHYLELSAYTMLSSGDRCMSFGEGADGFIDAEGVGAVVLKPLRDAERDGDHIYGVIKASAINAGGRTNGYTVPNPVAQSAVVAKALQRANLDASHISYVEAHGTGTALGDPIEIAGLKRAFAPFTRERQFCAIGSLKSNIGHCESAAGIAGLTKVLLQFQHRQLVPSLHADVTNHEIDFSETPFRLQDRLAAWGRPQREVDGRLQEIPRLAGISSFGAGGSNAHLIVQEYEGGASLPVGTVGTVGDKAAIPLSARTEGQLRQKVDDLLRFLRTPAAGGEAVDLFSLAWTLQAGREAMEERLGLVVSSVAELERKLASWLQGGQQANVHRSRVKRHQEAGEATTEQASGHDAVDRDPSRRVAAWLEGARVDWKTLYAGATPRRVSLPVYPFARDRYWREPSELGRGASQPVAEALLHPLLHRNVSDLRQQRYCTVLRDGESFIADHRGVDEGGVARTTIPAAVHLEMARAACADAIGPRSDLDRAMLEMTDIAWADPVAPVGGSRLFVALFAQADDQVAYEIYGDDGDGSEEVVHCQGQARLRTDLQQVTLDVARLRSQMRRFSIDAETHYDAMSRRHGLQYGTSYRGISALHVGDGQVLAEMSLPGDAAENGALPADGFVLHPALLDCALQAAGELLANGDKPSLPLALASLRVLNACTKEMLAWVRPSLDSGAGGVNLLLDIDLCDRQGKVCVQMRGLRHGWQASEERTQERAQEQALRVAPSVAQEQRHPAVETRGDAGITLAALRAESFASNVSAAPVQISLSIEA